MSLTLRINGEDCVIASDPETPLLFVLRDELKLKGAKLGCGLEQCGACAVLVDGEATLSCVAPAATFEGREIVTVEGVADIAEGRRVQDAFVAANAAQCGYCTSGLVVAATALALVGRPVSREEAKAALEPHLCRCGAHPRVLEAVEIATSTP
ncbi:(2Fe-2S)-binding protein [Marivita geojedonensis]|uniref:(2Fe-2S)-binding protein n=1 Tax=Marivita geojedonensis TaxID=1123756 RepID=UPI000A1D6280|nr:2Fe-2S iron-sulfur cluster-binding protein [Marivita geojedonensis]PRY77461.1 aerobic-type carbon monoxide dehydrogenase small subunit (CoxS/CutS family) [Marivita geojedonensis]